MSDVATLEGIDIEFGKKLWQILKNSRDFPFQGIFWLSEPNIGGWHLVVASPVVDSLGPRDAYLRLSPILRKITADSGQRLKVKLISPDDPMYEALRSVFGETASVEGARLGNTMVGGTFIDEAYLYEIR